MAQLIPSPSGDGPQGEFERHVVETLVRDLPAAFKVLPNFKIKQTGHPALEYDVALLAPHAVFVIEAKEWYGRLTGDDTEWLINSTPKKCPMWLIDTKCKVLKTKVGLHGMDIRFEPLLAVPDERCRIELDGEWAEYVLPMREAMRFVQDPRNVPRATSIVSVHQSIIQQIRGHWDERRRDRPRRIAGYEVVETIAVQDGEAEYLARRALIRDSSLFRIRTWPLSPYLAPQDAEQREAVIRRPAEALAQIGRHPNLLQILAFDKLEEEREFYEITEWSDYGTLHGFLKNQSRDQLTLRERLTIASGVVSALAAVHSKGLVHRNVCPETILIDADRMARLTDFDRAYLARGQTVFAATQGRLRNRAYVPPELEDVTDYRFDSSADMYSFGVLLYELLADEVPFADPAAARLAHGRPARRPSEFRAGVDPRLDEMVLKLLNTERAEERPSAEQAAELLRDVLGSTEGGEECHQGTTTRVSSVQEGVFDSGQVLDATYRIDGELGRGAFSLVLKVYHLLQNKTFAMKLLTKEEDAQVILDEYNRIGSRLPAHPNIARMIWMDRLAPPLSTIYILSEYVEGETLVPYCKGEKKLAWSEIKSIAIQLLDALDAMHPKTRQLAALRAKLQDGSITGEEYQQYMALQQAVQEGILHRDIKPANILLELPSHRPKLIDFNIASPMGQATGQGGTPRYWAPDRGQPDWRPDMDLFSLGVVLYELVTHLHPFPNDTPLGGDPIDPRTLRPDLRLNEGLALFLIKAVQPQGALRFPDAQEMKSALLAIDSFHAPPAPVSAPRRKEAFRGLTLDPSEVNRPNYNPYVTRLLTLFSQARRSNEGTRASARGLDEIARLTYVETRLDETLTPAIAEGRFRLVIITGNAGDGKTAYLQTVEQRFRTALGAAVRRLPSRNGSRWTHDGLRYQTNYDGSQDEEDVENDRVLDKFFAPFAGPVIGGLDGTEARLIAVNEGRLLDFLDHSFARERYDGLRRWVKAGLAGADAPPGALLVDLNLRAVTALERQSLVERQLSALVEADLWEPCDRCALKTRCPLKHNADSLRDETAGQAVRDRVRRLFELVHLRRRMHITMRDLRSALSWLLLRDRDCSDVAELLERDDDGAAEELASLYYPEAFAHDEGQPGETVDDRLVKLLRESDVGFVNNPGLDIRLDRDATEAVPWMTFEGRSTYARQVMHRLNEDTPQSTQDAGFPSLLKGRRRTVSRWRRWAYYERRDNGWRSMTPYRALALLEEIVTGDGSASAKESLRDRVLDAISLSEGMRSPTVRSAYLALRVSRVKNPSLRSYRLFPRDGFGIEVTSGGRVSEYLEYAPDSIDLVALEGLGSARLRISLDLLEMLELIKSGYRPSTTDLQGLFVNLTIFRNELLNLPFDRLIVTEDDLKLYEITSEVGRDGTIRLALARSGLNARYSGPQKVDHSGHLHLLWFSPAQPASDARPIDLGRRPIGQGLMGALLVVEPEVGGQA